jgi:hypothetical protein
MCDVWVSDAGNATYGEHLGVIERVHTTGWLAMVSGHPEYGSRVIPVRYLETTCRVPTSGVWVHAAG